MNQDFVLIAIESGEPAAEVSKFVQQHGVTFPVWLDPHSTALDSFQNWDLPSTYVIDRLGSMRLSWTGAINRATLKNMSRRYWRNEMDAKVIWHQGLSFTGTSDSGFNVPLGADPESGGNNDGFRPMELMAVSLAGCTAMDVVSILRKKQQNVTAFEVKVHADRAADHPKVSRTPSSLTSSPGSAWTRWRCGDPSNSRQPNTARLKPCSQRWCQWIYAMRYSRGKTQWTASL